MHHSVVVCPGITRHVHSHEHSDLTCPLLRAMPMQHGVFKACVDDVVQSGAMAKAGWSGISVTPDLAVVLQQQYGIATYQPYDKVYTGGKPMEVEVVVEAVKAA